MTQPTNAQQQADETAQKVAALLALYEAGSIPKSELPSVVAAAVYRGKVLASRAADILVSTLANRPPLGIAPGAQHLERLQQAAETALSDPQEAAQRLERLGEAETFASAQFTARAAAEAQGFTAYREDVAPDACEVCQPFRDRLHDVADDWTPHHPRCRCELVPVNQQEEPA